MLTKMYANTSAFLATLKKDERGVTAIEYALVAVTVATIVAAVFTSTTNGDHTLETALTSAIEKVIGIINGKLE